MSTIWAEALGLERIARLGICVEVSKSYEAQEALVWLGLTLPLRWYCETM